MWEEDKRIVFEILEQRWKNGITAVVSIHDLNLASMSCDRFLFFKDHKTFAHGTGAEVLPPEKLLQVYQVNTEITQVDGYSHIRLLKKLP